MTGGASGIGKAIALDLAEHGAQVVVVDRDGDRAKVTTKEAGGGATAIATDLADPGAILALRDRVVADIGLPNVIVIAAGFDEVGPFLENTDELWTALSAVNFLGPVRLCHAFLTEIVAQEAKATIVNVASDAGRVGSSGETVYAGTKGDSSPSASP